MKTVKIKEVFINGDPFDFSYAEVSVRKSGHSITWDLFLEADQVKLTNNQVYFSDVELKMIGLNGDVFSGPAIPRSYGFEGAGKLTGIEFEE